MLKKFILVLAVVILPFALIGAEIGSDHWTYKDIKSLVDSGIITKPLTKDSLSRAEVVDYINNGVDNVLAANTDSYSSSGNDLMGKIDKLYNLVKAYMTDMARTEKKLDDILETIGDLKVKKNEIEKKQNQLLTAMGMRINGESSAYMTDVLVFGSDHIFTHKPAERYRPITQFIDLKFSLQARKDIYAEATFRLMNLFGGFWGSYDTNGLRRFFIQADMPVSFVVGGYQGKLTPFTLWSNEIERPFESKIFSDKREMNKNELYLMDNTWPLTGAKIHTIVELFDTLDLNIQMMGSRLGKAKDARSVYNYALLTGGYFKTTGETLPHDQYMFGGRLSTDGTLKDILEIGLNFNEIKDVQDTGVASDPVLDNYVWSTDLDVDVAFSEEASVGVFGEFATSSYIVHRMDDKINNNDGNGWVNYRYDSDLGIIIKEDINGYAVDTALKGGIQVKAMNSTLKFTYLDVGNSFTAYAAQTGIYDTRNGYNKWYLTQNSTWNISESPSQYKIGGKIYPFTMLNPSIMTSYYGIASTPGNLTIPNIYENAISPNGDATPNRNGFKIDFMGDYEIPDLMYIQPLVKFATASEKTPFVNEYPRKFTVIEGGARVEFWQLALTAGYRSETSANDAEGNSMTSLASSTIDVGLELEIIKKKLLLYGGFKSTSFEGREMIPVAFQPSVPTATYLRMQELNHNITSIGGGIEYKIAKPAIIGMYFTNTKIEDNRVVVADGSEDDNTAYIYRPSSSPAFFDGEEMKNRYSFDAQELGVRISIFF